MNPEGRYVQELRLRAGRHLPLDFSTQVMQEARARVRRSQRNRLTVATAVVCLAIVLAAHWITNGWTDRQNRELWSKATQQITALEQTI
jgi:hypothetical protein